MSEQTASVIGHLVPLGKVIAITASGAATGAIFTISYIGVPAISMAPNDLVAKQWQRVYNLGVAIMPKLAISCSACFAFLATQSTKLPGQYPQWTLDPTSPLALYTAAALAVPSIVPYTIMIMKPTNDKLHKKADEHDSMSDSETRELIQKWKGMNYNRAVIALVGTVLGAIAISSS